MTYCTRCLGAHICPIGIVCDNAKPDVEPVFETEFFARNLINQVRRVLAAWGVNHLNVLSTTDLLKMAQISGFGPIRSLINFGVGVNKNFRFGQSPMAIEILGVPYSGPDPFSVLLCRDKYRTKAVVNSVGVKSPSGLFLRSANTKWTDALSNHLFPVIVKPNNLGNSIGITNCVAHDHATLKRLVEDFCVRFPDGVIIENFISGIEATVLMFGCSPNHTYSLGLVRADGAPLPRDYYIMFEEKTATLSPTRWRSLATVVDNTIRNSLEDAARKCWKVLDCRDAARFDFRIDEHGSIWFLEANGQPDLELSSSYVTYLNEQYFGGNVDGVIATYLETFFCRVNGFESD